MAEIPESERQRILLIARMTRERFCGESVPVYQTPGPKGACIVSTHDLRHYLELAGIDHALVEGSFVGPEPAPRGNRDKHHWWIQFPQYDDAILDTTADQFGAYPEVWFPAPKEHYLPERVRPVNAEEAIVEHERSYPDRPHGWYTELFKDHIYRRPIRSYRRSK